MARALKIVGAFALAGFMYPVLWLEFWGLSKRVPIFPPWGIWTPINTRGLNHANLSTRIIVWLHIGAISGAIDAVLCAVPGIVVAFAVTTLVLYRGNLDDLEGKRRRVLLGALGGSLLTSGTGLLVFGVLAWWYLSRMYIVELHDPRVSFPFILSVLLVALGLLVLRKALRRAIEAPLEREVGIP
jgi:hypothetical protein